MPALLVSVAALVCDSVAIAQGQIVSWPSDDTTAPPPPPSLLPFKNMVAAGGTHSLAIRADGSVAAWGNAGSGQCAPPSSLGPVTMIAAGGAHSIAVRGDRMVACWGDNRDNACTPPTDLG